jgi:mono/diheme cytochrome c family protein
MTRVQIEISLGIILVLITSSLILVYGLNENNRMAELEEAQVARSIEVGAELFQAQCSRCHGTQGLGIPSICPPLNDRYFFDDRLADVGWSGTQEDYIVATASSGRLSSTRPEVYPGGGVPAMPSFSDRFGGPLREDQIRSIADYIMNWEPTAELVEVAQPADPGQAVGTDINVQLPEGDAAAGEALAVSQACTACHIDAPTGPSWLPAGDQPGIGDRASERITDPTYTGIASTPEQYLLESIVDPNIHIVDGFTASIMPQTYGGTLTSQNAADLIAYLLTLK